MRKKSMPEVEEIIRRLKAGFSQRAIARDLKVHRNTVQAISRHLLAQVSSNETVPPPVLPGREIYTRLYPKKEEHPLDAFRDKIHAWVDEDYSFVVMSHLIQKWHRCDESTLRRYIHKSFPKVVSPVVRRPTKAGEIAEVDFGYLGLTMDRTGKARKTYVLSIRLCHSRKAYRYFSHRQTSDVFLKGHILAFEDFGGVPIKIRPDNLKAAVVRAAYDDPMINKSYQSLAEHYGFFVDPCLPYHPEHKGGVESDVKYVKKNFWPIFRETEKEFGQAIPRFEEIMKNYELWRCDTDNKPIGKIGISRADLFANEEKQQLHFLPPYPWSPVTWKSCKVAREFVVQFNRAFYTVPYKYIAQWVEVKADMYSILIFQDGYLIATHAKATSLWQTMFNPLHAPPKYDEYMNHTQAALAKRAAAIGPFTAQVADAIFGRKHSDGLKPVRFLVAFAKKYSALRLEAACKRAVEHGAAEYRPVKNILQKGLDLPDNSSATEQLQFRFARPFGFFNENYSQGETNERYDTTASPACQTQALGDTGNHRSENQAGYG